MFTYHFYTTMLNLLFYQLVRPFSSVIEALAHINAILSYSDELQVKFTNKHNKIGSA